MRSSADIWPIRPTIHDVRQIAEALRTETIGGIIMLLASVRGHHLGERGRVGEGRRRSVVASVALGLTRPERVDHYVRPVSAGLAVPLFAFLFAGIALSPPALGMVFTDRVVLG